jgi:3-keto-5-aminohexanoate cleavage enzyme
MRKLIITAAIQGAEILKGDFPYLPVTRAEVANESLRAWNEGAAVIHLHVRDDKGQPTQDKNVFQANIEAVRATGCQAVLQVTTGGAVGMTAEERMQPVTLKPEYASLNTGSINFGDGVFLNPPDMMRKLAASMKEYGVKPEFEVYEEGHVHNALALVREGLVTPPYNFQFVLGVPGAMAPSFKNLLLLSEVIPSGSNWGVAGVGRHQLNLGAMSILMDGNVRVGFEDNIYYSKGIKAKSNAELVARVVRLARELGRDVASSDEARTILGIETRT